MTRRLFCAFAAVILVGYLASRPCLAADGASSDIKGTSTAPKVRTSGNYLLVESPYWTVRHNLQAGGSWDSITFKYGSGKNLLGGQVVGRIRCQDPRSKGEGGAGQYFYAENNDREPKVKVEDGPEGPVVTVEGQYQLAKAPAAGANMPQKLPVRFRRRYEYRQWGLVACELEILCDQPRNDVVEVIAANIVLRKGMTDALVRDNPDAGTMPDGTTAGKWLSLGTSRSTYMNGRVPLHMVVFEKGGEGLEFMPGSDLSKWEKSLVADQALGYYGIDRDWDNPENTLITLAPYCIAYRRNPIHIEGNYKLRYYIALPFIKDRATTGSPYMQCSANSRWLSDQQLETIAKSGIKLIRFHNDYAANAPFWHDGVYPPYDAAGMAELKRVINTTHRLGMKIIPYISVKELHPDAPEYAANHEAWGKQISSNFKELHTWAGSGEFGQLMCLESGWLDFRKKSIETILSDLPWDGLYFDWCTPHPCRNPDHMGGATHVDQDAFLDFMFWCRKRVGPDGIIMTHLSGLPQVVVENMADISLIFEDLSSMGRSIRSPLSFPVQCTFMPIAPRHICGWGRDKEEQRCAMLSLLQGHPTVPYSMQLASPMDQEPKGLTREFRLFGGVDFTQYRFARASDQAVTTDQKDVFGAIWYRQGEALVYLVNLGDGEAQGKAKFDAGLLMDPAIAGSDKALAVRPRGDKTVRTIPANQLKLEGMPYALKPMESALIQVDMAESR